MIYKVGTMFGISPMDVEESFTYEEAILALCFKRFENHAEERAFENMKNG